MAEPLPPPSLARAREQKISELSAHFANDDLSLDDLERRIERVYKASSIVDLDIITSDLPRATSVIDPRNPGAFGSDRLAPQSSAVIPSTFELAHGRMLAIMSSTRRTGRWAVPRDLRVVALMSDTKLDLTSASLPVGGFVDIDLTCVMASFRLIVPPEVRVVNEMHSIMADVRSGADELLPIASGRSTAPVVRLRGTALMADVKIKVRRREEPYYRGDDDDEDH
ncbi:MAG TPA: DUF1707 domain-containing protein [Gemmatimonadaceae bacterium]